MANNKKPKRITQSRGQTMPPTPTTSCSPMPNDAEFSTQVEKPAINAQEPHSPPPFATPPTSPDLPATEPSTMLQPSTVDQLPSLTSEQTFSPTISAGDIISKDIVAIADIFATMKKTMHIMTNAFDRLEIQTGKFSSLSLDIKAAEQLKQVRQILDAQITHQKSEIEVLGDTLKTKIKEAVQEKIKAQLYDVVKSSVREKVEEKVISELSRQIPEDLGQQIVEHRRQILEIRTNLHNSEARRYNASLLSSSTAQLRPLLRPLPTPEQSPTIIITTDSALNSPMSAMPDIRAPAPTPIKRSTSNSFKGARGLDTVPPTPSPLFPRDLKTLFKLGVEETKTLLQQYGLVSGAPSPVTPKPKGLNENEKGNDSPAKTIIDDACHVEDMNKFMAHIGVPFLMIPPPRSKEPHSPTLSPTSRRRMLAPLIISATPKIFY